MITTTLSIAKIALLGTLTLTGVKSNTDVSTMKDEDAANIISNLVSPESRLRLEQLISVGSIDRLASDEEDELKSIINEASVNLNNSFKPWA